MNPIRILHVLYSMNRGGTEAMLMNYYRNIDRDKLQFDFLLAFPGKSDYEEEIIRMGGRIYRIPGLNIWRFFPYVRSINDFFKSHNEYKIVHAHVSSYGSIVLYFARKYQIPVRICHSHNASSGNGLKGYLRSLPRLFFRKQGTDFFSCGQQAALWLYGESYCSKNEIKLLNNAIAVETYTYDKQTREKVRTRLSIPDNSFLIGHVGRFTIQKNHSYLLEIFRSLKESCPQAILLLIGDGPLRTDIERKINEMDLTGSVILTGVVENVPDYLQAMDVFVFPSFFEGLSVSLVEAQAAGLKIFTSSTVDKETSMTDLISYLSLEDGASKWAARILESGRTYERKDTSESIRKSGYDIKEKSGWLESFYLEKTVKINNYLYG